MIVYHLRQGSSLVSAAKQAARGPKTFVQLVYWVQKVESNRSNGGALLDSFGIEELRPVLFLSFRMRIH